MTAADGMLVKTLAVLWSAALVVATLGTWVLYGAAPGVNWGLVTLSLSLALLGCAAVSRRSVPPPLLVSLVLALALAMGAAMTADVAAHVLIALTVGGLLTIAIVLV